MRQMELLIVLFYIKDLSLRHCSKTYSQHRENNKN